MHWRTYFLMSEEAVSLENCLRPCLKEYHGGISSTANTDVTNKIIHLDVSQPPLKSALSYTYELKNLQNADKYNLLNILARSLTITKAEYVKSHIALEAEAAHFRCKIFRQLCCSDNDLTFNRAYLQIYDTTKSLSTQEALKHFSLYIENHGIVRKQYAAKKYYSDCYDYYSGKNTWPSFYTTTRKQETFFAKTKNTNIAQRRKVQR